MDWEKICHKIQTLNWVVLLMLGVFSFYFAASAFTLGAILGGLMIIANFNVLQHTVRRAFCSDGNMTAGKKTIIIKYYLRLAVLGILIYTLLSNSWVHPIGLVMGLSTVVISIITLGIHMLLKHSTWGTT